MIIEYNMWIETALKKNLQVDATAAYNATMSMTIITPNPQ
jgi:hypothetical protein